MSEKNTNENSKASYKPLLFSKTGLKALALAGVLVMSSCQKEDLPKPISKDPIEVVDKVDNMLQFDRSPEQISDKVKVLFHLCYDKQEEITKEESTDWIQQFQALTDDEYVQYINYGATQDAATYNLDEKTAKYILFKRIIYSLRIYEKYPNKLDLYQLACVGSAMLNNNTRVSLDPTYEKGNEISEDNSTPEKINSCFSMIEYDKKGVKTLEGINNTNMYFSYAINANHHNQENLMKFCIGHMNTDTEVLRAAMGLIQILGSQSDIGK